ncbi:MAG: chromate transporter [Candidatus Eremiobacteraeota bacterium]|nr:chromate transporter [Candidatus Eremiobacteraeota bacterium]
MNNLLFSLAVTFALLSVQAVGGGSAILPEMQRQMLEVYHLPDHDFARIFALGQVAPGPNMSMVGLLGYRIAGFEAGIVVLLAFFVPASVLCYYAGKVWDRIGETPWRRAVQDGLAPVSIGLMSSGVYAIAKTAATTPLTIGLAIVVFALVLRTKINPSLFILGCGVFGGFFLPRH